MYDKESIYLNIELKSTKTLKHLKIKPTLNIKMSETKGEPVLSQAQSLESSLYLPNKSDLVIYIF